MNMQPYLNEKQRRLYLATEARSLGHGGIKALSVLTGISENTLSVGIRDVKSGAEPGSGWVRKPGGGRKAIHETQKGPVEKIRRLVDGEPFGNPENPLSYTTKSLRNREEARAGKGFQVSHRVIGNILQGIG
jgi:hypothetical protein